MARDLRSLPGVTPPHVVGPMMLVITLLGGSVAVYFCVIKQFDAAIVSLLFTICLQLMGFTDLLLQLIMLAARSNGTPVEIKTE